MCFSAEASFGAGIVLTAIGAATLKKEKRPNEIYFASIPLIFGAQQITEGLLWLALQGKIDKAFELPATYIFLFIAQVIWPLWIPYSIYKLERVENRKRALKWLIAVGVFVALYNIYCFLNFDFKANIDGKHISYPKEYPFHLEYVLLIGYNLVTLVPSFVSSVKRMWEVSLGLLVFYIITGVFYQLYFVSIFCFFASIISIAVLFIMNEIRKQENGIIPDTLPPVA